MSDDLNAITPNEYEPDEPNDGDRITRRLAQAKADARKQMAQDAILN